VPRVKWFCIGAFTSMLVFLAFFPRARPVLIPYYSYLRMLALSSLGKNPVCSAADAARGIEMLLREERVVAEIAQTSRHLQTDANRNSLWDTPRGQFWLPPGADRGFLSSLVTEQTVGIYRYPEAGVRRGDIVLDCGANVGAYTREALRDGARLVVAIEPAPENLLCLRRNLAGEIAEGKVVVYEKGVWDREEERVLEVRERNPGANAVCRDAGGCVGPRIRLTTIDKLVSELALPRVDFIKMDIEGAEQQAVAGAGATLAKYRPRMAIATEHLEVLENAKAVVRLVRKLQPAYRLNCGRCESRPGRIVAPDVLHFH